MTDGIKSDDTAVDADALLLNDWLPFAVSVDTKTGEILTDRLQRATDRGLTFTLIPRQTGGYRVEMNGSMHTYGRNGLHNADDFTADDLLLTLDQIVTTYGIDPFTTRLNNVEFGVNVVLPFPVSRILDNLISYKNRPFYPDQKHRPNYYQSVFGQYIVKIYAKGRQFAEVVGAERADYLLRVEVKVTTMEFLERRQTRLNCMADLLTVSNYPTLGRLLSEVFTDIVFSEPTINPDLLPGKERTVYLNAINPRYWKTPDDLTTRQQTTHRKGRERTRKRYRAILDNYRTGPDWQSQTAELITEKWAQLTTTDDALLTRINERRAVWKMLTKVNIKQGEPGREISENTAPNCHVLTAPQKPELSRYDPLYLASKRDTYPTSTTDYRAYPETIRTGGNSRNRTAMDCPTSTPTTPPDNRRKTAVKPRDLSRPTAAQLRADPDLLTEVERGRLQYAKGSKENPFDRAAHNLRNDDSNPRNNLARQLRRLLAPPAVGYPLPLFTVAEVVRLTPNQLAILKPFEGTRYEVKIQSAP